VNREQPKRSQHLFVVQRTDWLSTHLLRVTLGGDAFDGFVTGPNIDRLNATDSYVKLMFARPDLGLVPPYDLAELRERLSLADLPVTRTYTVSGIDAVTRQITIDFVVHGDNGIAGPWAAAARPGDILVMSDPGGSYLPDPDPTVLHLLLGDDSAIPAIAAALAALPADATGHALIEVPGPGDEVPLELPSGVELRWLHRSAAAAEAGGNPTGTEPGSLLVAAVRALPPAAGPVDVFAHGERSAMKAIGAVLKDAWGLDRRTLSLSAYWALGRAEDRFQAEKREPVGQLFAD